MDIRYVKVLKQGGLVLRSITVQLEDCSRPGTPLHRLLPACRLRHLGSQVRQVPDVPSSPQAVTPHPRLDSRHHLHLRSQLFLRAALLAHASIQRVWSRPRWCGHPRITNWLQHLGRCSDSALASQSSTRS